MPFKSEAQRRKFGEMVKQGKMTQAEFDKWNKDTPKSKLPDRVHPPSTNRLGKTLSSVAQLRAVAKEKLKK